MSSNARVLAELIDDLSAELPLTATRVAERLAIELEEQENSNFYFTMFAGTWDGPLGKTGVDVREPTDASRERGKNGVMVLTFDEGPQISELMGCMDGLQPTGIAPYPGEPDDREPYEAERSWGRLVVDVDRASGQAATVMLDTNP